MILRLNLLLQNLAKVAGVAVLTLTIDDAEVGEILVDAQVFAQDWENGMCVLLSSFVQICLRPSFAFVNKERTYSGLVGIKPGAHSHMGIRNNGDHAVAGWKF